VRVAVYRSNHDVRLEEMPRPAAGDGEILMRVEASGICGSDVMEWYRVARAPLVLGHEVAGVVEETGPGVTGFRAGDRIVTTHHVPCGSCRYCRAGNESVCDLLRTTHFEPGGFAEFVRVPKVNVEKGTFLLPDSVTFEEGSFVEPLACAVRAQRIARVGRSTAVLVLGSGISGILHVKLARALGAPRVLATDVSEYRLQAARAAGADGALRADTDVPEQVRVANEGRLADVVLVCTAALPAIAQSFRCVERGGTILFFAPVAPGVTFPVPMHDVWKEGITLAHSYAGPPAEMREALDLITKGTIDVTPMVTHRVGLAETGAGFQLVADAGESLKVIVEPQR
jgi:L-iditol 2-dehydrogenase